MKLKSIIINSKEYCKIFFVIVFFQFPCSIYSQKDLDTFSFFQLKNNKEPSIIPLKNLIDTFCKLKPIFQGNITKELKTDSLFNAVEYTIKKLIKQLKSDSFDIKYETNFLHFKYHEKNNRKDFKHDKKVFDSLIIQKPTLNIVKLLCKNNVLYEGNNYESGITNYSIIEKKVLEINSKIDQGLAYIELGDYAAKTFLLRESLSNYYNSRVLLFNNQRVLSEKYYYQGILCNRISDIFLTLYFLGIKDAIYKSIEYQESCIKYFKLGKAKRDLLNDAITRNILLFAVTNTEYFLLRNINERDKLLTACFSWYKYLHKNEDVYDYLTNFNILYSIGVLLRDSNKIEESSSYFFSALLKAVNNKNLTLVVSLLHQISINFALSNKKQIFLKYEGLLDYTTKSIGDITFMFSKIDLSVLKANLGFENDALLILNEIITNNSIPDNNFILNAILNEMVIRSKYFIFKKQDKLDSIVLYSNYLLSYENLRLKGFIDLLNIESNKIQNWKESTLTNVIELERELKRTLKINNSIILKSSRDSTISALSVAQLKTDLARKTKEKAITDSINAVNTISLKQAEITSGIQNRKTDFILYIVSLFLLVLIALYFLFLFKQKNKRKYEALKQEALQTSELAKNKIHNYSSDVALINVLIRKNSQILNAYIDAYSNFLSISFESWKKNEAMSLEDELNVLFSYVLVKEKIIKFTFKKEIEIEDIKNIKFIQSIFDTILDNSCKHGIQKKQDEFIFSFSIKQKDKNLYCTIIDNGIPPSSNEKYLCREGSGLNILIRRIEIFYSLNKIKCPKNFFEISILPNRAGTQINLIFPYVTLQHTSS